MAKNADIIFISVKPQYVTLVVKQIKEHLTGKLLVSIAAGTPLSALQVLCYHWTLQRDLILLKLPRTPVLVFGQAAAEVGSKQQLLVPALEFFAPAIYRLCEQLLCDACCFCCSMQAKLSCVVMREC